LLFDLTAAAAAGGKVRVAEARGERIPEGWLVDAEGNPTTDPAIYSGNPPGALLPFGGHKGHGLAMVLDLLSGALSPAGCSMANSPVTGNALFVQAIKIESFQPLDTFREEAERFVNYVKSSPPAPGFDEVMVPGERSHRTRERRLRDGIDVEPPTWKRIEALVSRFNVAMQAEET